MSIRMILLPVFVQVALTFVLLFWGGVRDRPAGERANWRDELDLPVLFYVLTIVAWHTQFADLLFLLLAWVFVALRVLRSVPHGSAQSRQDALFISSAIVLALMWAIYAIRLLVIAG